MSQIEVLDPQYKISDNFKYYEMIKSSNASRNGIDNNVTDSETLRNAELVAKHCLEPIRAQFGSFGPNSWFRCEALEKFTCNDSYVRWCKKRDMSVGAKSWAAYFARKSHPTGGCVDIEVTGTSNDDLYEWCKDNLEYDQLIREFRKEGDPMSGWVHISFSEHNNRKQAFYIP